MPWPSASLTASVTRNCVFAFSRTATVSPAFTEYDAMLTTSPLTVIERCETMVEAQRELDSRA